MVASEAFEPVERGSSPLVGRAAELARILALAGEAAGGRGRMVVLAGPAGIGKTFLAEQAVALLGLPAGRVHRAGCLESAAASALLPWRRVVRGLLDGLEGDALGAVAGPSGWALADLVPEHAGGLSGPSGGAPSADPQERRFTLLEATAGVVLRSAAREPLALLLDDVQWADPSSLEVLGLLAAELAQGHLLLLVTCREPPLRPVRPGVARLARFAEWMRLDGLGLDDTAELVRREAGAVPAALAASIHGRTRGNPFFVGETVRFLRSRGALDGTTATTELPESVREVVRGHLGPLAPETRELLGLAAVLGQEFELPVLRAAAGLAADAVLERIGTAVEHRLVEPDPASGLRFRFAHGLIPETLYADLTPLERARLHRQIAAALETLHGSAAEPAAAALAHHWFRAAPLGEAERALHWTRRAGQQAFGARAYEEAAAHLSQALDALTLAGGDERTRLELLLELARAQTWAGLPNALETHESAVRLARAIGDPGALARAALESDSHGVETPYPNHRFIAVLEEGLGVVPPEDSPLRVALLARLASAVYFTDDPARCDALSSEAVERGRRLAQPVPLAVALVARQYVLWGPDADPAERLALAEEALALLDDAGEPRLAIACERWRIQALLEGGDLRGADAASAQLTRRCAQWRLPLFRLHARHTQHVMGLLRGRYADVALELRRDEEGPLAALRPVLAHSWEAPRLMVRLERGGLEASETASRALLEELPDSWLWRATLALVVLELGREAEARSLVEPFAERGVEGLPRDGFFLPTLALVAEVAARVGAAPCAAAAYPALLPLADRHVVFGVGANGYGSAERYLGLLAHALGRRDDAVRHLERGLERNERAGLRPFAAWCRLELGEALAARGAPGDRERAAALRAEALREAEPLGMGRLLRRAGAAPGPARAPAPELLSASPALDRDVAVLRREGEVWRVAFAGRTTQLRHTKGLAHLAELLLHPGREFHARELATVGGPARAVAARAGGADDLTSDGAGDAGELLDARARAEYGSRLEGLRDALAEAERFGDAERATRAREEIDLLAAEVARATGLGGRARRTGSDAERARLNVTRTLGAVLRKIARECPELGEHLAASVRTGTFCAYRPDPRRAPTWDIRR